VKELHVLVDFENVQPSLAALVELAPGLTDVWLFHGPHQTKQAQTFAESHERVTLVPRSGKGPNALDFHLSFYLGYVAAKHPAAQLVVVANDKGYDPMIAHAELLGFAARRVGYKTPTTGIKEAVIEKVVGATPPEPAKAVVVASPAPAKSVAKKTPAKKVAVKKAIVPKAATTKVAAAKVAVKAAAKTTAAKEKKTAAKVVVKKVAPQIAAAPVQSKAASAPPVSPAAKTLARVQSGLIKMGSKAPTKLKSFLSHVGALLGKDATAGQIDAMVTKLEAAGVVRVNGDKVVYGQK